VTTGGRSRRPVEDARHPALLLKGGTLIDPDLSNAVADVLIEGDRIVEIAPALSLPGALVIEARGKYLMPGLVNAHTHSGHTFYRGLADKLSLGEWMIYVLRGADSPGPRECYVSAALGALEMLRIGTTSTIDHGPSATLERFPECADAVMQAYLDVGMRAAVAPSCRDLDYFATLARTLLGSESRLPIERERMISATEQIDAIAAFFERWKNRDPRLSCQVGPAAPERCSVELLDACIALAHSSGSRMHLHLLETRSQRASLEALYRESPIIFLARLGLLGPSTSAAHCVWVDKRDIEVLAYNGVTIVHNPISNLKLGSGLAPIAVMSALGASVALGGDGAAASDSQNMFEVMKAAALTHRPSERPRYWLAAEDVLRMGLHGGSSALGVDAGALRPGALADLAIIDGRTLFGSPKKELVNQLVYADLGRSVETVIVGGEVVLEAGRSARVSEENLYREAAAMVAKIYRGLPQRRARLTEAIVFLEKLEVALGTTAQPADRGFDR
jgi:5-methylthioadenosine/S-adenosylhomocysteine deaminase